MCLRTDEISFRMTWKNNHFPSAGEIELKAGERLLSEKRPCLLLTICLSKLRPSSPQLCYSPSGWCIVKGREVWLFCERKRQRHVNSKGLGSPSLKVGIVLILFFFF